MTSKQQEHGVKFVACVAFILLAVSAPVLAEKAKPDQLSAAYTANALTAEGKAPFHIKISFQLFDLNGKESETGTIEEWWVSPSVSRLVVTSPSLTYTVPNEGHQEAMSNRENFLVQRLLEEASHPFPDLSSSKQPVNIISRTFSGVQLSCYVPTRLDTSGRPIQTDNYCVDPKTSALLVRVEPDISLVVRDSPGVFHQTNVALALSISYLDKPAIAGKVVALQSFDAARSDLAMTKSEPSTRRPSYNSPGITAGKLTYEAMPQRSVMAASSHAKGTVILHAIISKQGTVQELFPLATSNATFTDLVMDAVKLWTYKPYLSNGEPTDVESIISFTLGYD
jgi:hypothetical protein